MRIHAPMRSGTQTTENRANSVLDNAQRCAYISNMLNGGNMTPEERLEKIEERIDAIAMHLEVLSGLQVSLEQTHAQTEKVLGRFIEATNHNFETFFHGFQNHEQRIDALEGN